MPTVKKLNTEKSKDIALKALLASAVRDSGKLSSAEQDFFNTGEAFKALRAVSFLIFQMDGPGVSEWSAPAFDDLRAPLELIAEHGIKESDERLEAMTTRGAVSA